MSQYLDPNINSEFKNKKNTEEKQKKLEILIESAKARKKKLSDQRSFSEKAMKIEKPLYLKIQEKFTESVIMPEIEQQKEALAKKKLLYQPISHIEMIEHMKKHGEILKINQNRRANEIKNKVLQSELNQAMFPLPSFFYSQSPLKAQSFSKSLEENKKKSEKRHQYSKLVKEFFPPVTCASKQKLFPHNSAKQFSKKKFTPTPKLGNQVMWNKETKSESIFKPRKWKKNPMIPEKPLKRVVIKKDYLAEMKKKREMIEEKEEKNESDWENDLNSGEFNLEKIEKIRAKAESIEKKAAKQERKLEGLITTSDKGLEAIQKINDLIISSIKAKLAILEKVQ